MQGKILDAAASVFSRKGYHKASMDEISADAGVAKGSLYYHFHDKSQLFQAVAVRGMEELRCELQQATELEVPINDKVAAVIDRVTALCFDYSDIFNIIMSDMAEGIEPEAWRNIQEAKSRLLDYITGLLREGWEYEHIIRKLDFELVTYALLSFIYTYRKQSIVRGDDARDKILGEIREVVMHGIMAK
jgi:TetR/AcrR family transcriptional regulator